MHCRMSFTAFALLSHNIHCCPATDRAVNIRFSDSVTMVILVYESKAEVRVYRLLETV